LKISTSIVFGDLKISIVLTNPDHLITN